MGDCRHAGSICRANVRQCVSDQGEATQESQQYTSSKPSFRSTAIGISRRSVGSSMLLGSYDDTERLEPAAKCTRQRAAGRPGVQPIHQSVGSVSQGVQQDLTAQVGQVNQIAQQIASINQQIEENAGAAADPGLSANMSQALEQLSQYADVSAVKQDNGTVNVSVGQASLVSGTRAAAAIGPRRGRWSGGQSGQRCFPGLQSGSLKAILNMTSSVMRPLWQV